MTDYRFRLVNVFTTEATLSGNPLCVFEDARGLDTATMQALTLQFNLSETTFVLPSGTASARVRIFATAGEMPFAGHPTLGTAHVVRQLRGLGTDLPLEMQAGVIPVTFDGERYALTANAATTRPPAPTRDELATMLGLTSTDLGDGVQWVSTGNEQLLVPLKSEAALRRAAPVPALASRWANDRGMVKIYCFVDAPGATLPVRFFFSTNTGAIAEDPGTGSACANLGGWWLAMNRTLPWSVTLHQGDHLGRACRLFLDVGADRTIRVGGRVIEIASGAVRLS
ncbi:MAG: PhzF family phenazine biosynthesis protein [Burkholderiales bacterium]